MGTSMVSEVYGDSSVPDLLRFMEEIAIAMEYMHSAEVVHGDLKVCFSPLSWFTSPLPVFHVIYQGANVLLDNDLRCVLADFGHSKRESEISYKNDKHARMLRSY